MAGSDPLPGVRKLEMNKAITTGRPETGDEQTNHYRRQERPNFSAIDNFD